MSEVVAGEKRGRTGGKTKTGNIDAINTQEGRIDGRTDGRATAKRREASDLPPAFRHTSSSRKATHEYLSVWKTNVEDPSTGHPLARGLNPEARVI